jgi:hypothetical protein
MRLINTGATDGKAYLFVGLVYGLNNGPCDLVIASLLAHAHYDLIGL